MLADGKVSVKPPDRLSNNNDWREHRGTMKPWGPTTLRGRACATHDLDNGDWVPLILRRCLRIFLLLSVNTMSIHQQLYPPEAHKTRPQVTKLFTKTWGRCKSIAQRTKEVLAEYYTRQASDYVKDAYMRSTGHHPKHQQRNPGLIHYVSLLPSGSHKPTTCIVFSYHG